MLLLLKNVDLHAPAQLGRRDILVGGPEAGGRILAIAEHIAPSGLPLPCLTIDCEGLVAAPGLVDNHVHVTGGGGEGGWATRTPELRLVDATLAGVTTVIGVLGTDGVARGMEALVAKTYALREEGLSAWCYTGSYRLPLRTLTGDAMKDIMLVEPVIGIGEIALSDHRSSKPSEEELARLASEARVGGMLAGKAGVVNIHLGDAPAALEPLRRLVERGDLPMSQLLPTHCGRSSKVFEESLAWAAAGGLVDFTTSSVPAFVEEGEIPAGRALALLRGRGIPLSRVSFSSDGQGSLPLFNAAGELAGVTVGTSASLLEAVREAVSLGVPFAEALPVVTENPARALKLCRKGRIAVGLDADIVLLEPGSLAVRHLLGGGRLLVRDGQALVRGAFDSGGDARAAGS
jgi:beta-aspartyl-dipeptidase (metallo-type)